MVDETVIEEAGRRLARAAPGARVILFGSHARGDAGPNSDLDFLIVEDAVQDELREAVRLRRALKGLDVSADVTVLTRERVDEWRHVRGGFVNAVMAEGRVLHGG